MPSTPHQRVVAVEESTLRILAQAARENQANWELVRRYREEIEGWERTRRQMRSVIRWLVVLYGFTLLLVGVIVVRYWNVVRNWF